jgi:hypothetical protein
MKINRIVGAGNTAKLIITVLLMVFVLVCGCVPARTDSDNLNDKDKSRVLTVKEEYWWEADGSTNEAVFENIARGDVISEGEFGKFTVKSVTDEKIVIGVKGGFVESNGDTIDMNGEQLTKIKLNKGESIGIASTTYDAGVFLLISYN